MNRRELVKNMIASGGILSALSFVPLISGCHSDQDSRNEHERSKRLDYLLPYLTVICDIIIPSGKKSGGAKEAGVPEFIMMMLTDCYSEQEQKVFLEGFSIFNNLSKSKYGGDFLKLEGQKKVLMLENIDKKVFKNWEVNNSVPLFFFYRTLKELTVRGFFTSETGAAKALRYVQVPSKYDGDFEYNPGDKAWAAQGNVPWSFGKD